MDSNDIDKDYLYKNTFSFNIDFNSDIKVGQILTTSNNKGLYLKGLIIGYILKITEDKDKLTKTSIVSPFIDFNDYKNLYVLIPIEKYTDLPQYNP